jgi:hypothetical protein
MEPTYFSPSRASRLGFSVFLVLLAAGVAALGYRTRATPLGWMFFLILAVVIFWVLPYLIYSMGYQLRADAHGLALLWRGRERRAFPWTDVLGMCWAQRSYGRGNPDFFVAHADGSVSKLPIPWYTTTGGKQADAIVACWQRAQPGLTVLNERAKAPVPFMIPKYDGISQAWFRAPLPESE